MGVGARDGVVVGRRRARGDGGGSAGRVIRRGGPRYYPVAMNIAQLNTQAVKSTTTNTKTSTASQGLRVRTSLQAGNAQYQNYRG